MMKILRVSAPVTYLLIAVCILFLLLSGVDLVQPDIKSMLKFGANFQPFTFDGEPWRLITSVFLHYGFLHLLLNSLALWFLGRTIEPNTGSPLFLFIFLICGIAGSLASSYWNLFAVSMGASGAIFGLFGFDLVMTLSDVRHNTSELLRVLLTGIIYIALILLIGQLLPFDNMAHAGGLAAGIILGILYILPLPKRKAAMILTGLFLVLTGYLVMPGYQVIHYNQFTAMLDMEEKNAEKAANFTNDALALEGYREMKANYDSLSNIFLDTMNTLPETLQEDRNSLYELMQKRTWETHYKIALLEHQSYRYLDSIELVQRRPVKKLNHPLSFEKQENLPPKPDKEIAKAWYDEDWKEIQSPLKAMYYRLGFKDSLDRWHGQVEDYFLNGGIQMKGQYSRGLRDGVFRYYTRDSTYSACGRYENEIRAGRWEFFHDNGRLAEVRNFAGDNYLVGAWSDDGTEQVTNGNGEVTDYYENGEIRSLIPYKDGLAHGMAYGNYEDGSRKYEELFENGTLVQGRSYNGNSTNTYDRSIYYPFPSGGMESFEDYVSTQTAQTGLPSGKVRLIFTCPPSGQLYNIRVWESVSPDHDRAAVRILENGPEWIPVREHALTPVISEGTVTITF